MQGGSVVKSSHLLTFASGQIESFSMRKPDEQKGGASEQIAAEQALTVTLGSLPLGVTVDRD
jgi:hypothetical protein